MCYWRYRGCGSEIVVAAASVWYVGSLLVSLFVVVLMFLCLGVIMVAVSVVLVEWRCGGRGVVSVVFVAQLMVYRWASITVVVGCFVAVVGVVLMSIMSLNCC